MINLIYFKRNNSVNVKSYCLLAWRVNWKAMTVARVARICAHGFKKASSQYLATQTSTKIDDNGLLGSKLFSEWGRVKQEASWHVAPVTGQVICHLPFLLYFRSWPGVWHLLRLLTTPPMWSVSCLSNLAKAKQSWSEKYLICQKWWSQCYIMLYSNVEVAG